MTAMHKPFLVEEMAALLKSWTRQSKIKAVRYVRVKIYVDAKCKNDVI